MNTRSILALLALIAYALGIIAAAHALLRKRNPQSALAWVTFILLVPYVGTLFYILIGVSRVDSHANSLLADAAEALNIARQQGEGTASQFEAEAMEAASPYHALANVGLQLTDNQAIGGNCLKLLRNGEEAYPEMLKAIAEARTTVFLSTYIFKHGSIGEQFSEALALAAERGVDVRVIIDGFGDLFYTRRRPWRDAAKRGAKFKLFIPPRLFPPQLSMNLRTHRKVLVCDGKIGFTGGMNISDDHMLTIPGKMAGDMQVRCIGPIAALLHQAFLMDWAFVTHTTEAAPEPQSEVCGNSYCRLVFDGLGKERDDILDLMCGVISGAQKRVYIMNPYFLPPNELAGALTSAVLRGVDVRVILPAKNNMFYIHRASRHIQPTFIKDGVKIYFQPAPFVHTKLMLIDDHYALIGSANMDSRSLLLNFELNMEVFDDDLCRQLDQYFEQKMEQSTRSTLVDYSTLKLRTRLLDAFFWIFSPYL